MLHIIDNYYAQTNNYGYTVVRNKKNRKTGEVACTTLGYVGTMKETLELVKKDILHRHIKEKNVEGKECGAFRGTGLFKRTDRTDPEGYGRDRSLGGNMLQQLYSIQEIGILLLQISGFLFALLVIWLIILAGAELFRDRINARMEEKRKEMEILKEKNQGRRKQGKTTG